MFREKWIERMKGRDWISKDLTLTKPEDFTKHLETFLEKIIKETREQAVKGKDEQQLIEHMRHHLGKSPLHNARRSYYETYNAYQILVDERRQEAKADMVERIRYLLFRMLTAIGIAAVVMGTYYLAGEWGIELPMARAVLGAPL
ncbi:MAG: hypothetical protein AB2821_10295 [Candidatus Thiodiazotropha endolucinida]